MRQLRRVVAGANLFGFGFCDRLLELQAPVLALDFIRRPAFAEIAAAGANAKAWQPARHRQRFQQIAQHGGEFFATLAAGLAEKRSEALLMFGG